MDLRAFGGSALTDPAIDVPRAPIAGHPDHLRARAQHDLPLRWRSRYAEVTGSDAIFTGANAVDYSGYPDCRPEFMEAFERIANLATRRAVEGAPIAIESPIIGMRKDEIMRHGHELGVDFSLTVSCYEADAGGRACGACEACRLRREGFERAGLDDPTRYRAG